MNQQRHARKTTRRKCDQPQDNGCGGGGFFFYSKHRCVSKERRHLRAAADSRQLHRRADQCERHHEHGGAEVEAGEGAAKTVRNPEVNEQNEEPVSRGIKNGQGEIARSLNGLHTAHEAEKNRSEEHTSELQSLRHLVCRLLLEKKKKKKMQK